MSRYIGGGLGAFLVGILMVVTARMNGQMSVESGSPVFAAVGSFGVGTIALFLAGVISVRLRRQFRGYVSALRRRELSGVVLFDGVLAAASVTSQAFTVGMLGVVVFTVTVVSANLCCGLLYDRLGTSPVGKISLTRARYLAAALVIIAAVLSGGRALSSPTFGVAAGVALACTALAGCLLGIQQSLNARTQHHTGSFYVSVLQNFAAGFLVLFMVTVVFVAGGRTPHRVESPWLLASGLIALVMVGAMGRIVGRIGVLSFGVAATAGQLSGATLLDLVVPVHETVDVLTNALACGVALLAVALTVWAQWHGARRRVVGS